MGLKARSGGDFEAIPAGVYMAVCTWVVDLGTQHNPKFNIDEQKILINWEVVVPEGDRRFISQRYSLKLGKKANLRKAIEAWQGRSLTEEELKEGFDVSTLVGKPCQLQIVHKTVGEKTYANIQGIMSIPNGMAVPEAEGELIAFDFDEDSKVPEGLPDWVVDIMKASPEYTAMLERFP